METNNHPSASYESRHYAAIIAKRREVEDADAALTTSKEETAKRKQTVTRLRKELDKLLAGGLDMQTALPLKFTPDAAADYRDESAAQEWRTRDVRVLPISIPSVNALYAVPLETLGALWDFWADERSLLTVGGFTPTGNGFVLDGWAHYCDAHAEVPRLTQPLTPPPAAQPQPAEGGKDAPQSEC